MPYLFFLLLFGCPIWSIAQTSDAACPNAFYLLRNDTIFELNSRSNGDLDFIPYYQADFLDSVGALSYSESDAYWYAINFNNAHLVRFQPHGRFEDLGRPMQDSLPLPNEDLTTAVIVGDELFVLAYSTNSIYAIHLHKNPLRYRTVVKNIGQMMPNTLAYHPQEQMLYILNQAGTPISIDPRSGRALVPTDGTFANFPRKQLIGYGKLWFSAEGRCFLLAGIDGIFYELDTKKRIAYRIAQLNFNSTKDATACPSTEAPPFLMRDLLEMNVHLYSDKKSLEVEWHDSDSEEQVRFFYTESYNPETKAWEERAYIPGYVRTQQANRYTMLDRRPIMGENCYRLRIEYNNGAQRYSRSVCMNFLTPKNDSTAHLVFSPELLNERSGAAILQISNQKDIPLSLELYGWVDRKLYWKKDFKANSSDVSLPIPIQGKEGWYELKVNTAQGCQHFRIFKH